MTGGTPQSRDEIREALRGVGTQPDEEIDIAQTALLLGALDRPRVPLDRYLHHLSLLDRDTADLAAKPTGADNLTNRAETLNKVMLERYAYQGDHMTYDNLQNANLLRVIDRRKGLPVALGILYIHAANAQGWRVAGVGFPGHFMLRLDMGQQSVILDPFNDGVFRSARDLREMIKAVRGPEAELHPEDTSAVAKRDVLLRLQNNIKLRLIEEQRAADALKVIESMLLIAPQNAPLLREAGVLYGHLDNLQAAIDALERFLLLSDDEVERHSMAKYLQELKPRLN